jgi:Uma2 family endonuclease
MAAPALPLRMTAEEYLAFDAAAPEGEKYEFYDGWVVPRHGYDETGTVAMAGASPDHNTISVNLAAVLSPLARQRGCRYGTGDQRIRARDSSYVYSDFVLVCDEPVYSNDNPQVLENPTFVVEVTSESTAAVDRGRKLEDYTALASLREYWVVEQDEPVVTQFVRDAEGWRLRTVRGLDAAVSCGVLEAAVPLADVYALVDLEDRPPFGPAGPPEP